MYISPASVSPYLHVKEDRRIHRNERRNTKNRKKRSTKPEGILSRKRIPLRPVHARLLPVFARVLSLLFRSYGARRDRFSECVYIRSKGVLILNQQRRRGAEVRGGERKENKKKNQETDREGLLFALLFEARGEVSLSAAAPDIRAIRFAAHGFAGQKRGYENSMWHCEERGQIECTGFGRRYEVNGRHDGTSERILCPLWEVWIWNSETNCEMELYLRSNKILCFEDKCIICLTNCRAGRNVGPITDHVTCMLNIFWSCVGSRWVLTTSFIRTFCISCNSFPSVLKK